MLIFKFFISFAIIFFNCNAHELSICAIFRDEANFLKEWIDFHRIQGVEHFYLYNNLSRDNYKNVLKKYDCVTLIEWPAESSNALEWNFIQCSAYNHCLATYGSKSKWIAFLDTDEFLFCLDGEQLPKFLNLFVNYSALGVNWHMFGTSNVEKIPHDKLMIELLIRCSIKDNPHNRAIKSIVQSKFAVNCHNPHFFNLNSGKLVDENFEDIDFFNLYKNSMNKIKINHYWTRTEEFFRDKKKPRRNKWCTSTPEKDLLDVWKNSYNLEEDFSIQQFVPKMKTISD